MKAIGLPANTKLTEYELSIASQLIHTQTIQTDWTDIGGLREVCQEIKEAVLLPLKKKHLFAGSTLMQPPKGDYRADIFYKPHVIKFSEVW